MKLGLLFIIGIALFGQALPPDPPSPVALQSYSTGTGVTVTLYRNFTAPGTFTNPVYGVQAGETVYGQLSAPATVVCYGTCANVTLSQPNSTTVKIVAGQFLACHDTEGLQPLPCDTAFFTKIDNLPLISSHYIGDGSGYCEDGGAYDKMCQGDPATATGFYTVVGAPGGTCKATFTSSTSVPGNVGAIGPGGSVVGSIWSPTTDDCHIVFPTFGISPSETSQASILDGTEPINGMWPPVYGGSYGGPYPDLKYRENNWRQNGAFSEVGLGCNFTKTLGTSVPQANPAFANCPIGATPPPYYYSAGGADQHEYDISLSTYHIWEIYNAALWGYQQCQAGPLNCQITSGRHLQWYDYSLAAAPVGAIGNGSTPENQIELTTKEMANASVDPIAFPIKHALPASVPTFSETAPITPKWLWPTQGISGAFVGVNGIGILDGARFRLSHTRTSLTKPLWYVKMVSAGSGYAPGTIVTATVTGCTALSGGPASVIAVINAAGSVASNTGVNYIYITNTGTNCSATPTITFPPPTSGTTITATGQNLDLTTLSVPEQNALTALYNQATQYGWFNDDTTSGSTVTFRSETSLGDTQNATYLGYVHAFYGGASSTSNGYFIGFTDLFLWEQVDEVGLTTAGSTLWPTGASWPTATPMNKLSWLSDQKNTYEGSTVQQQNILQVTATTGGTVSYSPVPTIGTAVGFNPPGQTNTFNVMAGAPAINMAKWGVATGNASLATSWSFVTDPCPSVGGGTGDSLTSSGVYTPCSPANFGTSITPLTGQIKIISSANTAASTLVNVTVMPPLDSNGVYSQDVAGPGGCVNGASYTSGTLCSGAGTNWTADIPGIAYKSYAAIISPTTPRNDNHWTYGQAGIPSAPNSVMGEVYSGSAYTIYQTFYLSPGDVHFSMFVPNGNYQIRLMLGMNNVNVAGSSGPGATINKYLAQSSTPGWNKYAGFEISTQGYVQKWEFCPVCQTNSQTMTPVDLYVPAKVTNGVLTFSIFLSNPSFWGGWDPAMAASFANKYVYFSGFQLMKDTTTTPHWEIGSHVGGAAGGVKYISSAGTLVDGTSDNFLISPSSDSLPFTWQGAPSPGILLLYIRDVYEGVGLNSSWPNVTDAVWTILSGPGTIDSGPYDPVLDPLAGQFVAPDVAPSAGTCTVVRAQSLSTPSVSATRSICFTGGTSLAVK